MRTAAIDQGLLYDISAAARRIANVVVHTAVTARLWGQISPGTPFAPSHPGVSQLCYALLLAHAGLAPSQRLYLGGARSLIFECRYERRIVLAQCVAHPDERGELVATLMLEDEDWQGLCR